MYVYCLRVVIHNRFHIDSAVALKKEKKITYSKSNELLVNYGVILMVIKISVTEQNKSLFLLLSFSFPFLPFLLLPTTSIIVPSFQELGPFLSQRCFRKPSLQNRNRRHCNALYAQQNSHVTRTCRLSICNPTVRANSNSSMCKVSDYTYPIAEMCVKMLR